MRYPLDTVPQGSLPPEGVGPCSCPVSFELSMFPCNILSNLVLRPVNASELYNLRHAQARNVVERIFGVLKARFGILTMPPHFSMDIQVRVPPGLAAVHNMIVQLDPFDLDEQTSELDRQGGPPDPDHGDPAVVGATLATGPLSRAEERRAAAKRKRIAEQMWADYQRIVQERADQAGEL